MSNLLEEIPLEQLILDDLNPRLPSHLRKKSESEIISYMLNQAATLELMLAIGQNGFFSGEPLLVVKEEGATAEVIAPEENEEESKKNESKAAPTYRVIEGNRRLTALKLLRDPSLGEVKKKKIQQVYDSVEYRGEKISTAPCQVFKEIEPIHKYLGYRHITGIQAWDLIQKAQFLTAIWKQEHGGDGIQEASRQLAKMIGSRSDYVRRLLVGNQAFQAIDDKSYFSIPGLSETTFFFNYIADSLSRKNIANFLGVDLAADVPAENLNEESLKKWTEWFFEKNSENQTRIKATTTELRMLNKVLENSKALAAFEGGKPLNEAFEMTGELENVFQGCMTSALNSLENADGLTHKLDNFYGSLAEDLKAMHRLVKKIKIASEEEGEVDE